MKNFISKYKHSLAMLYFIPYVIWFNFLEKNITTNYTLVHIKLDDYIPFNEWFVIPYLLWFFYILIAFVFFFFTSKEDFYKACSFLFIGMTICLTIYTIWPNGQNLRPDLNSLGRDNILIRMVARIYSMDTPTNVFPSIHVFNSIGMYIVIHKSEKLKNFKWLQWSTLVLTILICLSTMFLKQHSAIDAIGAIGLCILMHFFVYGLSANKKLKTVEEETITQTF